MGRSIRVGDCVRIPDGRGRRVREVSGRDYRVQVRRPGGTTHQFLTFAGKELERVGCPKGWMSPEGDVRYLAATLAKMGQRQARSRNPG